MLAVPPSGCVLLAGGVGVGAGVGLAVGRERVHRAVITAPPSRNAPPIKAVTISIMEPPRASANGHQNATCYT